MSTSIQIDGSAANSATVFDDVVFDKVGKVGEVGDIGDIGDFAGLGHLDVLADRRAATPPLSNTLLRPCVTKLLRSGAA